MFISIFPVITSQPTDSSFILLYIFIILILFLISYHITIQHGIQSLYVMHCPPHGPPECSPDPPSSWVTSLLNIVGRVPIPDHHGLLHRQLLDHFPRLIRCSVYRPVTLDLPTFLFNNWLPWHHLPLQLLNDYR